MGGLKLWNYFIKGLKPRLDEGSQTFYVLKFDSDPRIASIFAPC